MSFFLNKLVLNADVKFLPNLWAQTLTCMTQFKTQTVLRNISYFVNHVAVSVELQLCPML